LTSSQAAGVEATGSGASAARVEATGSGASAAVDGSWPLDLVGGDASVGRRGSATAPTPNGDGGEASTDRRVGQAGTGRR
jgi:hypothetical protein